jgi:hypothetical protein
VDRHPAEDAATLGRLADPELDDLVWLAVIDRSPRSLTSPWRGLSWPEIVRSVVDFPAPFEPMSVTISPSSTSSETPRRAWMAP